MSEPIDLRLGRWQDVLADVECDAVICDPPYSPRQSEGFRSSNDYARHDGARSDNSAYSGSITAFQGLPYAPMSQAFANAVIERWQRVPWIVMFGDHVSFRWWEEASNACGRYTFAPVVWIRGNSPRFQGDGPCSAAEYICVSRLRQKTTCGSLPGFYSHPPLKSAAGRIVTGQKPLELMRAVVRDYTRPGDLVCDPCAGGATTLIAAALEGRRAVGAEMDPVTHAKAQARIREWQPGIEAAANQQVMPWAKPVKAKQSGFDL